MKVQLWSLSAVFVAAASASAQIDEADVEYIISEYTVGTAPAVHSSTDDVWPKIQLLPDTQHARIVPIQKLTIPQSDDEKRRPTPKRYNGFEGTGQTPWSPPDPTLAVGPNHVVETVNMNIAWWDKNGNLQHNQRLDSSGNPGFFEDVGAGDFTFDPKCCYDEHTGRFFVVALEVYSNDAWITFAISDDSDPNGTWYKYRTDAVIQVGGSTYWVDYPGLGYDQDAFYVTGNLFKLSGGGSGFGGAVYRAIDKSSILNGGAAQYADIRDGGAASVQVAQNHSAAHGVSSSAATRAPRSKCSASRTRRPHRPCSRRRSVSASTRVRRMLPTSVGVRSTRSTLASSTPITDRPGSSVDTASKTTTARFHVGTSSTPTTGRTAEVSRWLRKASGSSAQASTPGSRR